MQTSFAPGFRALFIGSGGIRLVGLDQARIRQYLGLVFGVVIEVEPLIGLDALHPAVVSLDETSALRIDGRLRCFGFAEITQFAFDDKIAYLAGQIRLRGIAQYLEYGLSYGHGGKGLSG